MVDYQNPECLGTLVRLAMMAPAGVGRIDIPHRPPGIWFKEHTDVVTDAVTAPGTAPGHPGVCRNADEAEPDAEPILEEDEEDEYASSLEELPSIKALIARLDQLELIEVERERIRAQGFMTTIDVNCRILVCV